MSSSSSKTETGEALENDVCFILTSAFLIFTMQTGYGLLESGTVSRKNEVNILLKNAVNIICGSLAFWCYGFAFSSREEDVGRLKLAEVAAAAPTMPPWRPNYYEQQQQSNRNVRNTTWTHLGAFFHTHIVSIERFFVHVSSTELIGTTYAEMMFQLAYATTCTSIISGAMAERCRFFSYFIFSFFSNILFCLPARWTMFGGWLNEVGAIDIAGSGIVHLVGGCAGLVAALLLGPRLGRFDGDMNHVPMGNPTNAVHGIILLWWGWLGYSAGSTFGSTGDRWKYASRASVATIMASMAGGAFGMIWSAVTQRGIQDIKILSYSILASLVAISGGAPIIRPVFAIITGVVASAVTMVSIGAVEKLKIDDPTDSFSVHAVAGAWGMIAIGLFSDPESVIHYKKGFRENITVTSEEIADLRSSILLAQLYAILVLVGWSLLVALLLLLPIYFTIGLRMPMQEEILGPDFVEHGIIHEGNRQLLNIIRQKIQLVSEQGLTDGQASAEVARRYAEQQRLKQARKMSLATYGSDPTQASPTPSELWPRLRQQFTEERQQRTSRYYHNHERRRLSIKTILDATNPGVIRGQPFRAKTSSPKAPSSSVWATSANAAENGRTGTPIARNLTGPAAKLRAQRKIQLSQYLEAGERTRKAPSAYRSPPLPEIED